MKMRMIKSVLGTVAVLALCVTRAFAWGDAGHMTVAAEAYRQLSPELKAQVFEVLKAHPDFVKWTNEYHPNPTIELAGYVFIRCSTWPDQIRGTSNEFDHPNWHFIDYPLRPPAFAFEPDARTNDDILYGIDQCEKVLSNPAADATLRAAQMSYLVHLVGDIHQPLHAESFYNSVYTNGDRGGNDLFVRPAQFPIRLHSLWDGLPGSAANPQQEWKSAILLDTQFPRSSLPELTSDTTPRSWSLVSRELAIDIGYLRGQIPGSPTTNNVPPLPMGYTKAAKTVADRQIALAGYRLADELQKYVKLDKAVPLLPPNTATAQLNLPSMIGTAQATNYYDEEMVVTGRVAQVSSRPTVSFINLDKPGPQSPFTAVIFQSNLGAFGDLNQYTNHVVSVSGTITEYRGRPEIVLDKPDEIKVMDKK